MNHRDPSPAPPSDSTIVISPIVAATQQAVAPVPWPHECESLCKAAEEMQRAINELWKAENPEEFEERDKPMDLEEAAELHREAWSVLHSRIYQMRKRMEAPLYAAPLLHPKTG